MTGVVRLECRIVQPIMEDQPRFAPTSVTNVAGANQFLEFWLQSNSFSLVFFARSQFLNGTRNQVRALTVCRMLRRRTGGMASPMADAPSGCTCTYMLAGFPSSILYGTQTPMLSSTPSISEWQLLLSQERKAG